MKQIKSEQSPRFVIVGVFMAVLAASFLFYMGNNLYQASQKMYYEHSSTYALK